MHKQFLDQRIKWYWAYLCSYYGLMGDIVYQPLVPMYLKSNAYSFRRLAYGAKKSSKMTHERISWNGRLIVGSRYVFWLISYIFLWSNGRYNLFVLSTNKYIE